MKKQLEINKDYGFVFGLSVEKGQHAYYLGENKVKLVQPGAEKIDSNDKLINAISEYINQPFVNMGKW